MVLARPIAEQGGGDVRSDRPLPHGIVIALVGMMVTGTAALLTTHRFAPDLNASPVAAVRVIKEHQLTRVLNDYDFGGYLIAAGVPTYIDGRTELFGEAQMVAHDSFSGVKNPNDFFALISDPRVEATLLRTQSAAAKLLDHLDGWRRIYADEIAVVHLRDSTATARERPVLRSAVE